MTTFFKLQAACVVWRQTELQHARAVLCACVPDEIRHAAADEADALQRLRLIVDSEPWAEILAELSGPPKREDSQARRIG